MPRPLGLTTISILAALEDRVGYGLDLTEQTGLLPGTVYTTLRRMERRNLLVGRWEDAEVAEEDRRPRRRYYTLTPEGVAALGEAKHHLSALTTADGGGVAAAGEPEPR
jgi:DNA-binding PadR family transcriptional regulator